MRSTTVDQRRVLWVLASDVGPLRHDAIARFGSDRIVTPMQVRSVFDSIIRLLPFDQPFPISGCCLWPMRLCCPPTPALGGLQLTCEIKSWRPRLHQYDELLDCVRGGSELYNAVVDEAPAIMISGSVEPEFKLNVFFVVLSSAARRRQNR